MVSVPHPIRLQARLAALSGPLLTGVAYFLAAILGDELAFPSAPVSALWAANAIVMAALLLARRDQWWLYLLAILCFHVLAQAPAYSVSQVLIQYLANTSEALIAALALQRYCSEPQRFDRVQTAVVLIAFGGVIAPFATSVAMAGAFVLAGIPGDFWLTVLARTITNTFAVLSLVPLIVHGATWLRSGRWKVSPGRVTEALLLAAGLAAICISVFVLPLNGPLRSPILLYAPLPLLAWGAMRFGVPGACSAALLLGAISTAGVLHGRGPFTDMDPVETALSVVAFQAVTALALVLFAAVMQEWNHAQGALRSSEARFRSIFHRNLIPTVIWRDDFRISEANEAFVRLTGFSHAEIAAGRVRLDQLTDCGDVRERPLNELLEHLSSAEQEFRLRDGQRIPVILGHARFADETGGVIYALDLSAFRRAEASRVNAESLHAAVLTSLHDQIAILDSAGRVVEINESWWRAVESAPAPRFDHVLPGANLLDACVCAAERGDRAAADLLAALHTVLSGTEARRQFECSDCSGDSPAWVEVSVEQLRRPDGGVVVTRTDITARKRAEIEARTQRLQLTHLGRVAILGQLSGAFAHELKQPLTSILGNAEAALRMLARGPSNLAELREILIDIVQDDERATQVIQRLRALLNKGDIVRQPVDLNLVIQEVLELARSELITRNITLAADLDPQVPLVHADRVQMQQVILNLLMNACEALTDVAVAERKVRVCTRFDAGGSYVEASVRDNGCGIPPADLERIFQPFVTTREQGMGLGLAICRSVAHAHGGRLWAESVGKGATFHLRLPIEGERL